MKRFTYTVLKEVEVLAENEPNALAGVVLEDYDNDKVMAINFQYEQVEIDEDFLESCKQGNTDTTPQTCAVPLNCYEGEPCEEGEAYGAGFEDGYQAGVSEGEVSERSRIHEALFESAQRD